MTKNVMFVLCGNCRTFIECFNNLYINIISKLFSHDFKIFIYLYLKLSDPGPKGQDGWNFEYNNFEYNIVLDKINKIKNEYPILNIEYKLLQDNEITDNELMLQVKDRSLYNEHFSSDSMFLRSLHCHYNFEKCGIFILEKEKSLKCKFNYIIYVRPDLFFTNCCNNIEIYNKFIITLGIGPNIYNNDHIAIIPREHMDSFFFNRMNLYRNNIINYFHTPEEVYWNTINFEVKQIGEYYIKRS